jgi:hypothetical protein
MSGAIAQLGERLLCKQEVAGSIPAGSTNPWIDLVSTDFASRTHPCIACGASVVSRANESSTLLFKNSVVVLTHQIQAKSMDRGAYVEQSTMVLQTESLI